jgi:hypothetical protein
LSTSNRTIYLSILVQSLAATFNIYVLSDHLSEKQKNEFSILADMLMAGLFIQIIEGSFYVWLVNKYDVVKNITPYRYYDWCITTPTMLTIFVVFLCFINKRELIPNNSRFTDTNKETLLSIIYQERYILSLIMLLNAAMLLFGYMGEMKIIWKPLAVLVGFIPFVMYFSIIYYQYAIYTQRGKILFWVLLSIWSLYGFSALLPYFLKNICYNILDLCSKNFFEFYLGYILYYGVL